MAYRYVVDQAADEFMATLTRREQRMPHEDFRFLAEPPSTRGEQEVRDLDGRLNQVRISGRFALTFRPDHAVQRLNIVAIELF